MKHLGWMRKKSVGESEVRKKDGPKAGLNPEERWAWWVERKVKMRIFSDKQHLLTMLKRDREAEAGKAGSEALKAAFERAERAQKKG